MQKYNQKLNFGQIDEIAGGDATFKKELIELFMKQIPNFIANMNHFQQNKDMNKLAREAHTAKSSALIFGMKDTGELLKQIQALSENKETLPIDSLIKQVEANLYNAEKELEKVLKGF